MKQEHGLTYISMILIIVVIALLVAGAFYFIRIEFAKEDLETVKTNMLLIQAKTKIYMQEIEIGESEEVLKGTKLEEMTQEVGIKTFLEKEIIGLEDEDSNYYVLNKKNLEEMELNKIPLEKEEYYIVNYKNNEIISTKGYEKEGKTYYTLSEIEKLEK